MHRKPCLIITVLATLILAPVLDVVACDDCREIIPLHHTSQRMENGADHSSATESISDAEGSDTQRTGTARDLCPICANAAAMSNSTSNAPYRIGQTDNLPTFIALSDPTYSITKPPQN